jgi:cephalosporin hydroxylase
MEDKLKNIVKKAIFNVKDKFKDKELIDKYHKLYYDLGIYQFTEWEGVRIYKYPSDLFLYQEIIYKNKPNLIIETGTLYGGSALFFARLFDIMKYGKVISIDNVKRKLPQHPRIEYLFSDSTAEDIIGYIKHQCIDKKVMVILDSDHHKEHVLKEMQLYSPLVSRGQYLIVEDGCANGHPVYPEFGPGPYEAIEEFMKTNKNFKIDSKTENKFLITQNPKGFLIRK